MTIFQADDLEQQSQAILDAARVGEARVRDRDGSSFLVVPEQRVLAWTAVVQAAVNLAALEQVLMIAAEQRSLRDYGDWTWLRVFDDEDLREFVEEMRQAVIVAGREESAAAVTETLHRWRVTADQLADPQRRAILLARGELREDDFIEVTRPQ